MTTRSSSSADRLPIALLAGTLALTLALVSGLAVHAWQTSRAYRSTAEAALRDYAAFAAWTFRYRIEASHYFVAMRAFRGLNTANQDLKVLRAGLDDVLMCGCVPAVKAPYYLRMDLAANNTRNVTGLIFDGPAPPDSATRAMRLAALLDAVVDEHGYREWSVASGAEPDGRPWVMFYAVRPAPSKRSWSLYAFEADQASLQKTIFEWVFRTEPLLPAFSNKTKKDQVISLAVTNQAGATIYQSVPRHESPYQGSVRVLQGRARNQYLLATATINPEAAERLLIGGIPKSPLPLVATLVVATAILLAAAAVFTWRTYALARLRHEFTSSVSHELRTPLTQILLYAEMLELGRLRTEPERRGALDVIVRESRRLIHLVENVLHMSGSSRRLRISPRPQLLAPIVEQVISTFEPQLRSRQVRVERAVDRGIAAPVDGDAVRQILINFLDNAVRYGPEGQTLTVGLNLHEGRARLWVRDHGPGIAPADRERLWQPFVRLENQDSDATSGSGIGLAVVRQLVTLHGGACGVEDVSPRGSLFYVEFPTAGVSGGPVLVTSDDEAEPPPRRHEA